MSHNEKLIEQAESLCASLERWIERVESNRMFSRYESNVTRAYNVWARSEIRRNRRQSMIDTTAEEMMAYSR